MGKRNEKEMLPFLLRDCLTDHYQVACYVKAFNPKISKNKAKIIYFRLKLNFNSEAFSIRLPANLLHYFNSKPILTEKNFNDSSMDLSTHFS